MNKRAIWIFDRSYSVLTYLSVASFVEHVDMPITLVYCEKEMDQDIHDLFSKLHAEIEIVSFYKNVQNWLPDQHPHIINRLARFHFASKYADELVFMFDSDMAFSSRIKGRIIGFEANLAENKFQGPIIWGVKEHEQAIRGQSFYFGKKDKKGDYIKLPTAAKENTLRKVFGEDWLIILSGPQLNNGVLVFYKCQEVIAVWKKYYLKGLEMDYINPADDQVPLAGAMYVTNCKPIKLNPEWNSQGKSDGDFIVYHVYSGFWKNDLLRLIEGKKAKNDFGRIIQKYWDDVPETNKRELASMIPKNPLHFREIEGFFDHGGIYDDIISELPFGHLVEIGTYKGRSACYMGELIKHSRKPFRFDTIDHFQRMDTDQKEVEQKLEEAGVKNFVNIIPLPAREACKQFDEDSLDLVFWDAGSNIKTFLVDLKLWYSKLKPGGILAGYDESIHDTVYKGFSCVVATFCYLRDIPFRAYKTRFFIQKPAS